MRRISLANIFSEKKVFLLFLLANLIPVSLTRFIGSLDGPQHLYISNVIVQLLKGNGFYQQFYNVNPPIVGNILGNYFLAFFNLFLQAWVAEKILIITCLVLFVTGFRYLVNSINGKSGYLTLLIFPFSSHTFLMLGYYNFSLAIALLFFALGYWVKYYKILTIRRAIVFFGLLTLTYYAHIFVFAFLLMMVGLYTTFIFIHEFINGRPQTFRNFLVRAGFALACAVPGLVLAYLYLEIIPDIGPSAGADNVFDHWAYLRELNMLAGFDFLIEKKYTKMLFLIIIFTILAVLIFRAFRLVKEYRQGEKIGSKIFKVNDFWFLLASLFLCFFFYFPNQMSIPPRVSILFFSLLILWIALQEFPPKLAFIPLGFVIFIGISLNTIRVSFLIQADIVIREIQSLEKLVPENTLMMTANYSDNWVFYHFRNYLGTEKPLVDLRSPACADVFAVNWTHRKRPFTFVGGKDAAIFTENFNKTGYYPTLIAEYVAIVGYEQLADVDPEDKTKKLLSRDFQLVYVTPTKTTALFKFIGWEKVNHNRLYLMKNPEFYKLLTEKAKKFGVPFEDVLLRDAIWSYDQSFNE
ncbi:MAG: hypothetical protein V1775_03495 [Bacteroidota bacterium]